MFFNITLALSVVIFGAGVIWRAGSWLKKDPAQVPPSSGRLKTAAAAVFRAVFSRRILAVLKSFAMDVLLQKTSLRQSPFRWVMHMLIWVGFVLLVVFHALDAVTSKNLFPGYYPTVNPYWMLRDILGGLVLLGVLMAAGRRLQPGNPRLKSTSKDWIALILLAVIMLSGFALAGMKITSKQAFDRMEREYSLITEKKESKQLEAFWAAEYGLEASPMDRPLDPEQVEAGAELNRLYCADCHSRPQTAPVSYVTAALIGPVAGPLDRINFASFLWHVHFLFVFAGLAYLPFGKFFHILATPAYLLARAGMGRADDPTGSSVMRAMALDACMHCGACSEICAVGSVHAVIPNDLILPSEKIALLQRLARGQPLRGEDLPEAVEGMLLCTNCSRCGDVCPAGIDLQKLWDAVREGLLAKGAADHPDPILLSALSFYRAGRAGELGPAYAPPRDRAWQKIAALSPEPAEDPVALPAADNPALQRIKSSSQSFSLAYCYSCRTCSSVCPLKEEFENPHQDLGLLPHQIIHAVLLGRPDMALGCRMLWACLGCYQCQEQCPQGVAVTEVFYELKNLALDRAREKGRG